MNIVFFAIFIAVIIVGCIIIHSGSDEGGTLLSVFGLIGCIVVLFISAGQIIDLKTSETIIDKKIEILEERNADIENELGVMAQSYIAYEEEAYENYTASAKENPIAFINIVPELSSNEVVKEQMDIYAENRQQIIALMTSKAELKSLPWYLYFGKVE